MPIESIAWHESPERQRGAQLKDAREASVPLALRPQPSNLTP